MKKVYLLLAVVCALIAACSAGWLAHIFFNQKEVLIVEADVQPRDQIPRTAIRKAALPAAAVPADAVASEAELAGKVTRGFVPAGTVLRESLLQPQRAAGAAGALAEMGSEYRLVSLPLTPETTVGGCVTGGDRVDIYVIRGGGATQPIVTNVLVYAPLKKEKEKSDAITIALRAEDVEKLVAAMRDGGKVIAALRPLEKRGES